jgi:hypothetical protein
MSANDIADMNETATPPDYRKIVKTRPCMVDSNGIYLRCEPGPHPWRPIGTAPTEGTPVLICWAGEYWDPSIASYEDCGETIDDGRWVSLNSDMSVFVHKAPTHWMPLPEPPG